MAADEPIDDQRVWPKSRGLERLHRVGGFLERHRLGSVTQDTAVTDGSRSIATSALPSSSSSAISAIGGVGQVRAAQRADDRAMVRLQRVEQPRGDRPSSDRRGEQPQRVPGRRGVDDHVDR